MNFGISVISKFKLHPPKVPPVVKSNVVDLGRAVDGEKLFVKTVKIGLTVYSTPT